eukprot:301156-Rhodomonas_salina.1
MIRMQILLLGGILSRVRLININNKRPRSIQFRRHSPQCCEEWAAVLQMMCPKLTDKQAQMMMPRFGFDDNTHGFVQHSNVTWKQWNYINMAAASAQGELFDKDPQVGFFVAMSWKDQQQWGWKGFSGLVVATSPNVYMRINLNACGSQKSNNTWT